MLYAEHHLTENIFSRPGKPLKQMKAVVLHYTQNPGQGPEGCRAFFESLKTQNAADKVPDRSASAHYIIGMTGLIWQVIPEREIAYHCGGIGYTPEAKEYFGEFCSNPKLSPNHCTIGIELCHPDKTGLPTPATDKAARLLIKDILGRYGLNKAVALWRHYDVTAKKCPLWFVDHPSDWERFRSQI